MYLVLSGSDIAFLQIGLWNGKVFTASEVLAVPPEQYVWQILSWLKQREPHDPLLGFVAVVGPGSPTALRASLSFANTFAFAKHIPLFGVEAPSNTPLSDVVGLADLSMPSDRLSARYGREPTITSPHLPACG